MIFTKRSSTHYQSDDHYTIARYQIGVGYRFLATLDKKVVGVAETFAGAQSMCAEHHKVPPLQNTHMGHF